MLVRLNWQNLPLQRRDGEPFDLLAALRSLVGGEIADFGVETVPDPREGLPAMPGRLVAVRKSPQAAEAARRRVRQQASKKGKTPDARTLEAAEYVFVFTSVTPERLNAPEVLELYRFRWQVELAFKRMKGLLGLDGLLAHDPALCHTFLLTQLLGALLVEDLCHTGLSLSPWGYGTPRRIGVASVSGGGADPTPGDWGGSGAFALEGRRAGARPGILRAAAPPSESGRSSAPTDPLLSVHIRLI